MIQVIVVTVWLLVSEAGTGANPVMYSDFKSCESIRKMMYQSNLYNCQKVNVLINGKN